MSTIKALGAVAAGVATGKVLDEQILGISRDKRTLNAAEQTAQFVAREVAAGRISNVERFIAHAKSRPDEEYLVFQEVPGSGAQNIRRWTFKETDEESNRIARLLLDLGVKPGDMIASLYQNTPEFVFVMLGAWKLGCTVAHQNFKCVFFVRCSPRLPAIDF